FRLLFLAIIQTFFLISWFSLLLLQLLRHLFYRHLKLHRQRYILIVDRKSGSAGMPRPTSYAVFCLQNQTQMHAVVIRIQIFRYTLTSTLSVADILLDWNSSV